VRERERERVSECVCVCVCVCQMPNRAEHSSLFSKRLSAIVRYSIVRYCSSEYVPPAEKH
jgi:hypothetical protein